ncbi:MAG: hypothetical protein CSB02_00745 [Bacteroidia bacterium]|nr:MAG: hypothetical protein CSB02_00745 [Bacteroidia bacterium]
MRPIYTYIFLLSLAITACTGSTTDTQQHTTSRPGKQDLIAANKLMVKKEKQDILDYIRRHGYKMQAFGDTVSVRYTLSLLNGNTVYNQADARHYTLVIGRSDKESGLLEALEMMKKGEKARLIVPAHLGFGLLGDQDKITTKTSLVYDIEILN